MDRYKRIVEGTRKFFKEGGFKKAVIGVSGGVDSALCLKIMCDAIGPEKVLGLIMPEEGLTKDENIRHAIMLCDECGADRKIIPINPILNEYEKFLSDNELADMNLRSRTRASILYHFANSLKAVVVGTSNKTEIMLGYFTKYGDGAVDFETIGSLYKTEVWDVAKKAGIPMEIVNKTPSAELKRDHSDEEELGISYKEADEILKDLAHSKHPKADHIREIIRKTEHKRHLPPVI